MSAQRLLGGLGGRLRRRRDGTVLGAEICDELDDLLVSERVREGRHLLATVEDLIGDFRRGPELVFAEAGEIRSLLAAAAALAVAVGATLVAKKDGADLLGGF